MRLLRLLPSASARSCSRWASPQGRVALIRVGLRRSQSALCGSLAGAAASGLLRWQAGLIELPPLISGNGAGDGMRTYLNH